MTHEEALDIQPGSTLDYWLTGLITVTGSILFLVAPFISRRPPRGSDSWQLLFLGLLLLPIAAQCVERLFSPVHAVQRTAGLSPRTRDILNNAKPVLDCISWALMAAALFGLWDAFLWILIITSYQRLFSDLLGERRIRFHESSRIMVRPWREYLKPVHSDHWGER